MNTILRAAITLLTLSYLLSGCDPGPADDEPGADAECVEWSRGDDGRYTCTATVPCAEWGQYTAAVDGETVVKPTCTRREGE